MPLHVWSWSQDSMDLSHAFATGIRRWCFRCSPFLFLCSKRVILGVKLLSLRLSSRLLDQVLDEEFTRVGRTTGNNRVHITLPYFARRSLSTNDPFINFIKWRRFQAKVHRRSIATRELQYPRHMHHWSHTMYGLSAHVRIENTFHFPEFYYYFFREFQYFW